MVQNIFRAFDYAREQGFPLNISVVLQLHERDSHSAATLFEMIRHKYRDWLHYQSRKWGHLLPPLYVYAFEAPGNPHVNWVVRVPPFLLDDFLAKLPRWVKRVQGPASLYDLHISTVDPRGYKTLAAYIAKGCEEGYLDHFHLTHLHARHGPQGEFWGKRAGVSPALSKAARDAAYYNGKSRKLAPDAPPPRVTKGVA